MGCAKNRNGYHAVFVYGTLKSGHLYHDILRLFEGEPAVADGFDLYRGPGYPFAVPGDGSIHGEVYCIDDDTRTRLDALEGYPELFERAVHTVETDSDETVDAWIYFRRQSGTSALIPSGVWTTEFEYEEDAA